MKLYARTARFAGVLALVVAGLGLGGCANNSGLLGTVRTLEERNAALRNENQSLQSALDACKADSASKNKAIADLMALRDKLSSENHALLDQLAKFGEDLRGIKFGQLDVDTDSALRELAAQFPDVLEYDSDRGMLRFKSDFTFASGSDAISEGGRQTLDALGKILISPAASSYDIRIVGHTDSQKISANTAKLHPTNWHLSAHRAISVGRELITMGVTPTRVETAGRGEFDPIAPDGPKGNTPANRRVEVFLVRSYKKQASAAPAVPDPTLKTPKPDDFSK